MYALNLVALQVLSDRSTPDVFVIDVLTLRYQVCVVFADPDEDVTSFQGDGVPVIQGSIISRLHKAAGIDGTKR